MMETASHFGTAGVACLAFTLGWFAITPAVADDEPALIIFDAKSFVDTGNMVHVEGTLTGDGIAYKNNRSVVTCYDDPDRQACTSTRIDTTGSQVRMIGPPVSYTVRLWTADRIVADFAVPCGNQPVHQLKLEWRTTASDTWVIDRKRKTAELIEHPCLGAATYHWTIEDPPFWKKAKEGLGDSKAPR
jgi:hypothetical protein